MKKPLSIFHCVSTPYQYLLHLLTISSQFKYYFVAYALFHLLIFLLNISSTLLLDQCLRVQSNYTIFLLLGLCLVSSVFFMTCRHFTFYISNRFIKQAMWTLSIEDILMNLLNIHPLWLTSSSVSGETLRNQMVDHGLGALTNGLNRITYYGPMIYELLTSIWRLGVLNISIAATFVFILGVIHFHIFLPSADYYSKLRDTVVNTKRKRFLLVEKIEYSNLQKSRVRSHEEYKASVHRINQYRSFFNNCTLDADFGSAIISSLSDGTKECVGFLLIFWLLYQNDQFATIVPESSQSTTAVIILFVISMRNIVKSFSQVLEHKNHLRRELTEFQPLVGLLQSTFTSEDIISRTGNGSYDKQILQKQIDRLRIVQQSSLPLQQPRLEIDEAYATSLPTHRLHFAMLESKLSVCGGDLIFISGANGTGKSLFFHGLAGRFDNSMIDAISCQQLREIGYGNASFTASFHLGTSEEFLSSSNTTLTALSRAGYVCEENQAVSTINLGEKGTLTIGDILLRINGLLKDCTSDNYLLLHEGNSSRIMMTYIYRALHAVSLCDRLLFQHLSHPSLSLSLISQLSDGDLNEIFSNLCQTPLTGLSGGEQQRLRLASLFLLERIRYDVKLLILPKTVIGEMESQPMQLLLLDEPDHHIDSNFLIVISSLLQTLDSNHLENLIVMIIMHKEITSLESLQKIFHPEREMKEGEVQKINCSFPTLRSLRMSDLEASFDGVDDRDQILAKHPICEKAFEQYDKLLTEGDESKEPKGKMTLSISLLQEISL